MNKKIVKLFRVTIIAILTIYIITFLVVGRFLAYNDLISREKVSALPLKGYDYKNFDFTSTDGIKIKGWFIKSSQNINGKTLFLLHGWLSNRDTIVEQAKMFVDSGFNVILYDQRSHGESSTGLVTYGDGEGRDLLSAIEYSKQYKEINQDRLGAVSFSLGTGSAIYGEVFSKSHAFKAMVLEGTFATSFDVGDKILQDKFGYVGGKFVGYGIFTVGTKLWSAGRFHHSETADYVSKIQGVPLLIIRGDNDSLVPKASFDRFVDSVHTYHEVWCTPDGCHTYAYKIYPEEYRHRTIAFLKKYLD